MIAYPFRPLRCCLVTDGGGALILVAAERAKDFPQRSVYCSAPARVSRHRWSAKWRISPPRARFASLDSWPLSRAGITHKDVDHQMIYDAFAHLPIYGLEDLAFVPRGEAGTSIAERNTPRRKIAAQHQWRRSFLHAFRHIRIAGERVPDARHRPCPDPRRQDLDLPRRRRHVCRLRHDHHVKPAALRSFFVEEAHLLTRGEVDQSTPDRSNRMQRFLNLVGVELGCIPGPQINP